MANKATKQQIQDAMWDRLTAFGTASAQDAYNAWRRIKGSIDPDADDYYASYAIECGFVEMKYPPLPKGATDEVVDAFADLESELYEAKEAELMKGY